MDMDHLDIPLLLHVSLVPVLQNHPYLFLSLLQPAHALPSAQPVHGTINEPYPPELLQSPAVSMQFIACNTIRQAMPEGHQSPAAMVENEGGE